MALVELRKGEPKTSTQAIARGVETAHRSVILLLKNHQETQTLSSFEMTKVQTMGRPIDVAWLTEPQAMFLITLMKNSEKVVQFKEALVNEFFRMRTALADLLARQRSEEWLENRKNGKLSRKEETDQIKRFVEYATTQGSRHAWHYYSNITQMEYKALFFIQQKFPNIRDILSGQQLGIIASADMVVAKALRDGMDQELHYKDIYKLAKERVEIFSSVIPKTPVPMIESTVGLLN